MQQKTKAAKRQIAWLLPRQGTRPSRMETGKLRRCGAATHQYQSSILNLSHDGLITREENSYLPLRERERFI